MDSLCLVPTNIPIAAPKVKVWFGFLPTREIDAWHEVAAVDEATTDIDPEIVVEAVAAQAGAEAVMIRELSTLIVV